jgi:hypothetical protein
MSTAHNVLTGASTKTNDQAREMYDTLVRSWNLPEKGTKDGHLGDIDAAREMAREMDAEEWREAYGHERPFLAGALAGESYERGQDEAVDAMLERADRSATPDGERAAIDASIVQSATPIEVDPEIVTILDNAAPLLDLVTMEAQAGFTAQYNIISDRNQPVGRTSESDAIDLSSNSDGDFTLDTKTRDMGIYVDRVTLSDFTQRAEDSLNYMDVEETTLGQRTAVYGRYTAGELAYGDPDVGLSDGSIQDSNATFGMARLAQKADSNLSDGVDHEVGKSSLSTSGDTPRLDDLKNELTKLVTNTGASYGDLRAITGPENFDTFENEANSVTRLSGYDEGINFGGREINVKGVPLTETRAVGRAEHGQFTYNETGDTPAGNFDISTGDVIIYDESTFRHRQLAPLSTVPLGRRGLADEAALFAYSANIDKSHGSHLKFLKAYPQ